jgi:hypothetical protein
VGGVGLGGAGVVGGMGIMRCGVVGWWDGMGWGGSVVGLTVLRYAWVVPGESTFRRLARAEGHDAKSESRKLGVQRAHILVAKARAENANGCRRAG